MLPRPFTRKIHWQAPTVVILAFIAGLVFAIGHHAFYNHLYGRAVSDHLFEQQINLAVGQALAFLVRASLVISVVASYRQIFFGTGLRGPLELSQPDSPARQSGSALESLDLKASTARPTLVAFALLSLMVPLLPILPPATLSVQSTTRSGLEYSHVPVPQFDGTAMAVLSAIPLLMARGTLDGEVRSEMQYNRPTRRLSKLVTATAYQGAVPDHRTKYPNSTYTVGFAAPALRCGSITSDLLQQFNGPMNCSFATNDPSTYTGPSCKGWTTFLSWVPGRSFGLGYSPTGYLVPFVNGSMLDSMLPLGPRISFGSYDPRYMGGITDGPPSVFIATRNQRLPLPTETRNWNLLNCSMYNAFYQVNVTSDSNRRGVLSKPNIRALNNIPFALRTSSRADSAAQLVNSPANFGYLALMESFNRLLIGSIWGSKWSRLENTSYFSEDGLTIQNQGFKQTLLPYTRELLPFLVSRHTPGVAATEPVSAKEWTAIDGLRGKINVSLPIEAFEASTFNRSLGSVAEELFRNMTLSLFSEPSLLKDSTEAVEVAYNLTQKTYAHDSKNLLMSYGLAIGFTLIAGIVGCVSIYCNRESYSSRSSTALKASRSKDLDDLVTHNNRSTVDALPEMSGKDKMSI